MRRSRSPHYKRSSPREDRTYSGSPYDRKRDYPSSSSHPSGHGKQPYSKRRSRSPYYRKYSSSPHRTESRYKYRRRNRSPYRRDSDGYRPQSRSPSKRLHKRSASKERNYRKSPSGTKTEYEVLAPEFNYYGAEGFWIPGPISRSGYIPRGVIPSPAVIPRGMIRPGPYIFPRPYIPLPPLPVHQFRPRFSTTYNKPPRPRLTAPTTAATIIESASTVTQPPSSTTHNECSTSSNAATPTNNPVVESSVRDKS
ncbi:hypothetical protein ILUMI_22576 [Ignelater luminosus]|uniref:Uncharacterized protein n=1 Tax=Ignelater luminosus TaxID=2038154 RepID=A0A8K0CCJ3_IGNLU|nr:hypothetical protein ILUMI_22576 [Ignelater luminosus]